MLTMLADNPRDFLSLPLANFGTRFILGVNGFQVRRPVVHLRRTSGVGYDHRRGDLSGV